MEVLERREIEDDKCNLPDVQKAWAEFQKYYNTEDNDGKPLHDFDDDFNDRFGSEPAAEIASIKSAHEGINHGIKSIISVAAVICIILVGSFTAKALGYDIWDAIIVWTKDTFGFETNVNKPEPTRQAEISYAVFCLKKKTDKKECPSTSTRERQTARIPSAPRTDRTRT